MFRISKLTDYSTVVMACLAQSPGEKRNARDITEQTHLALPTVSKILKILTKAGLLVSHRGAAGGYSLSRAPEDISIAEIITAMEGGLGLTECGEQAGLCDYEELCAIRGNWHSISHMIHDSLQKISLADMAKPMQQTDVCIDIKDIKRATDTATGNNHE
ncbi:MAG: SUF system Fe-S cluster assembly regulator [Legionellales bacterium]|nr:SUF system Fe-S cluster assembly regulator [Legionellales bacterium]|tara:strand:+ start:26793 stop:27272 length:480 start_codon:yes stop_codon:yes gene_type:complete